ncbi:response regulator transcription factor [Kutzneria buriramensis]|uniref:DNA-binding NarL/FixJ family response regulator n=1 Tax=Kutzneria buriramensis TaxID=1045776 RepID=A0A3E0I031_9PSEU|nr:response regulator transcription factor [Kutzneria buriramensis]REH52053.1 DNA-binding NarL/FixJ family response regulator [Kutzneria buriramensis]
MNQAITVGVVDSEALVRGGVRRVLEQAPDVRVVAEAASGPGAVELVRKHHPRVLLMDIRMPGMDGLAATEQVRTLSPGTAVVLLTSMADDGHIRRALRAGATGFLLKDGSPRELVTAVRAVAAGEAMLSPAITRRVLDRIIDIDPEPVERARTLVGHLTGREREVLGLLAQGMGNLQIARKLYLSEGAVKAHVSRLLTKLSCDNRVQAAILAHNARLVSA